MKDVKTQSGFSFCRVWVLWVLLAAILGLGWADTWEELRRKSGEIHSVQSDFIQEKHLPILSKPLISKGAFYFQAPDSLRWEYQSPVKSILLMHKGMSERYIEGKEGIVKDGGQSLPAMQAMMPEIGSWLKVRFEDNPKFKAELKPGPSIELVPREPAFAAIIQRIVITLSDRPGLIQSVTLYESENSYTILNFQNPRLNQTIAETAFERPR